MKKKFQDILKQYAELFLSILVLAGTVLIIIFFQPRSELENQFLFGISRRRLMLGAIFVFFLLVNIGALIWIRLRKDAWGMSIENKIASWAPFGLMLFYLTALTSGMLLLAMIHPILHLFRYLWPLSEQIDGLFLWLFFLSSFLVVLVKMGFNEALRSKNKIINIIEQFVFVSVIFVVMSFALKYLLIWMSADHQSRYSYWNLLADEFLKGFLYLENPPTYHDLTLFRGKWYVPMPPLPAILMMPIAYFIGGENISTSDFSIIFSAINTVLVFLILRQLNERKWIKISSLGMFLLVILFAFGTPHLWVGIRGRAWFVSQILTVTFLALAIWVALRKQSPWLVGICLGLALLSRPNVAMTWPFVFAISMQILKDEGGVIHWKQILTWSIKSILPMGIAIAGLLFYNYARFENFLDFGYLTINGSVNIATNAQKYGLFSPHFIVPNIRAMFLYFPTLDIGGPWPIKPSTVGMNIFLVTPPLIYLFHRYERKWWILGAWVTVLLNFVVLIHYHNTGAHQFGYRYILDVIVPLITLLAVALNGKIRWHFILLLLFSIAFNIYGAYWFING